MPLIFPAAAAAAAAAIQLLRSYLFFLVLLPITCRVPNRTKEIAGYERVLGERERER